MSSSLLAHRHRRRLRVRQHPAGEAGGRLRDRARAEPQAVPRRRGARGPQARPHADLGLLGLFVVALGLPLYWLNEPGRQAGETKDLEAKFVDAGRGDVRTDRARAGSTAPSATAQGRRRRRAVHDHRTPQGDFVGRSRGRRRRSTRCCCATAVRRSPTSSPTAARSRRCRRGALARQRPAERPADPEPRRLPAVDPDHAEAGAGGGQEGAGQGDEGEGPDLRREQSRPRRRPSCR